MEIEELPAGGLRVRAPAKLNLYLEVSEARADGYHEIDSLFQEVTLYDLLDFRATEDGEITVEEKKIGEGERNLVYQAAVLLRERGHFPRGSRAGAHITLDKVIPRGAGLGGGSSDAAATLVALARLWGLRVSLTELASLGAELGSDVPFFLYGGTARCQGRGERVTPYHEVFDASPLFHYVIVFPAVHVTTKTVYEGLDRARGPGFTLTASSALDSMTPAENLGRLARGEVFFNRLEGITCSLFPELSRVSSRLKEEPFLAVSMTGSGSAFFGLCRGCKECTRLARKVAADGPSAVQVYAVESRPGCRFSWLP